MTAKAVKVENYTADQTAKMVAAYVAAPSADTVAALAAEFGKTVRSVTAKLSREKVYVAKTYKTKTGDAVVKKDEHADYIGEALGMNANDADSLTKANKTALKLIADFIKAEKAETVENPE